MGRLSLTTRRVILQYSVSGALVLDYDNSLALRGRRYDASQQVLCRPACSLGQNNKKNFAH